MKRMPIALCTAFLLAVGLALAPAGAQPASAAGPFEVYVSPDGDDSAAGTEDAPLKSLEAARDALRVERAANGLDEGATVYLRGGSYPRSESFELTAEDSGTADAPITYRSYPGETARLTGGVELDKNAFVPVDDPAVLDRIIDDSAHSRVLQLDLGALGITDYGQVSRHGYWKANDVSETPPMELYVGGEGQTLARWPNTDTVQMGEILDAGPVQGDADLQERGGTFTYTYDRPQYWTEAEDIWLDGIFGYSWEWSYNRIESIDTEAKTISLAYGEMSGLMKTWFEDFHFAENLLEELDAPGEYYIDRDAGILYHLPNAAFSTTDAEATVTMLDEPMIWTDETSHVRFDELVLEYGRATAAVILGGADVQITNSDIQNFADGGVLFNTPGRYTYDEIPVNRGGVDHAIVSSELRHIGGVAAVLQGGDAETLTPGNIRVENSHIHDFAYYHKAYNPALMFVGVGNIGRGNEIHDAPHPGIIVHGNNHLIEYNEIYDICKLFQDLGAIYMNAGATPQQRGTVISRNYFHDTGIGRLGVEGIYPDNLTRDLLIEENVFYRMGNDAIKNGSGDYITARNNVFVDTHIPYNNYEMWMGDEPGNKVDTDYMPGWIELFEENNGFVDTPYAAQHPELLTFFEEDHHFPAHNVFERNVTWNPTMPRSGDVNAHGARDVVELMSYADNWVTDSDPGFVDWQGEDFRLAEDAAVFDAVPGFAAIPFEQIGLQGSVGVSDGIDSIPLQSIHLPADEAAVPLGQSLSLAAEAVPWNADDTSVTYTSSDPAVASIDAGGVLTALAPGTVTVTATSVADPGLTDQMVVVVLDGDGVLHFTDFESGGNGWPVDGNLTLVEDESGDHWYRVRGGANGQLDRQFGDYVLQFQMRTPEELTEGGQMLIYDRSGATTAGYVRYQHLAAGSEWIIFDGAWGTVESVVLPAGEGLAPDTVYDIELVVTASGIRVSVDGELVIDGENPAPEVRGKVGFYVQDLAHVEFDDVRLSLVPVEVTGLTLSHESVGLAAGERLTLTASVTPPDARADVTWTSADPAIASVAEDGTVVGVAAGDVVITATSVVNPSVTAAATVSVTDPEYAVIDLGDRLTDVEGWPASESVSVGDAGVSVTAEGVVGYAAETFGDGLLRFDATVDAFEDGWFGFAVRSDRPGDPPWVDGNKGYLVVIKEDVIEFQSWKPGQTMIDVIPNSTISAGTPHTIEFGVVAAGAEATAGSRLVLRVDGVTVWSRVDADAANPIASEGYLNVFHYVEGNGLLLAPTVGSSEPGEPGEPGGPSGPGTPTDPSASGGGLALTGGSVGWAAGALAAVLLILGTAFVLRRRSRV